MQSLIQCLFPLFDFNNVYSILIKIFTNCATFTDVSILYTGDLAFTLGFVVVVVVLPFIFLGHCIIPVTCIHQVQNIHPHSHAVQQLDSERDIYQKCIMIMFVWLYVLYILYLKLKE